jgi:hypothetical protein
VSWLLDDPARRTACRDAGPAFVAARFGLDRLIDETLRVYGHEGRAT